MMPQPPPAAIPVSQRWRRHGWWCLGLGMLWLAAWWRLPGPGCLFLRLTGWPCPLCGGTRAFRALAHGDWTAALWTSPLAVLLGLALGLCGLWHLAALAGWSPPSRLPAVPRRWRQPLLWLLLAAILANWAYRLGTGQR